MSRLNRRRCIAIVMLALLSVVHWASDVHARPPYKHVLKRVYGSSLSTTLHQCSTCHLTRDEVPPDEDFDEEYPPHNIFGERLRLLGEEDGEAEIGERLRRTAEEDADGDGIPNELEILAGTFPGRATSRPSEGELASARAAQVTRRTASSGYQWEPFQSVRRPSVPSIANATWVRTPVDCFIAAEHEQRNFAPAPEVARHILLRRVYLDLIGLPPTQDQLRAFLANRSPTAYEQVVDELLASPQYGQRWGRHWMDIWRYSDWAGWTDEGVVRQIRDSQRHIWRWRDWIVESLNADRPYDAMVRSMLAADELTPLQDDELRATGFLVRNFKLLSRETWMQETVEHTAKAFLGLTLNCARCHDHMYDPISQEEYYRFRAIFEPHQIRTDHIPGEFNLDVDGLARAYDADLTTKTYLFVRGDDRNPKEDYPLPPGIPQILGGELDVTPIALPITASYPGRRPHTRAVLLQSAVAAVDHARQEVATLEKELGPAQLLATNAGSTDEHRESLRTLLQKIETSTLRVTVSESQAHAIRARMAADDAKYAIPQPPDVSRLARMARQAECVAQLAAADVEFRVADQAVVDQRIVVARQSGGEEKRTAERRLHQYEEKAVAARKSLESARSAVGELGEAYTPVTGVYPTESTGRRAALAHWLTAPKNPLFARVAVNHIWNRHFGRPLVESVFDFGLNGKVPTHPALLDWLAAEIMQPTSVASPSNTQQSALQPWSMKHLHRMLVTSSVYRMANQPTRDQVALDPDNQFWTRMPVRRMEAEIVRDSVLFLAEHLSMEMGGADIDESLGFAVPRRSMYFRHAAEKEMTFLKIFDASTVNECYLRKSSIMPQQALAMVNSELTIVQSRRLARRGHLSVPEDDTTFIENAFEHLLSRSVKPLERETCLKFLSQRASEPTSAELAVSINDLTRPAAESSLRAREQLLHVLLNHHEFVTIN